VGTRSGGRPPGVAGAPGVVIIERIQIHHAINREHHLFEKMHARMKESDCDVPMQQGHFYYYTRTQEGQPFKIHCRALSREIVRLPTC